jgi:hypothetical protein
MQRRIFVGLLVFCLFSIVGGAQNPPDNEKPVWMMEIIKVKPGQFGPTLFYLDDNWMRVREKAKRQGAVLSYHRIAEESASEGERNIVLLTEFKNQATYDTRGALLASILDQLQGEKSPLRYRFQHKDLYETVSTQVFEDYQLPHTPQFRLITQN